MPRAPARRWPAALALLLGLIAGPAAAEPKDFAAVEAAYRAGIKKASLHRRTQARIRLARTDDPRAISILADDYLKPEDPKDHVRYLLATIATEHLCSRAEMAAPYAAWRARAKEAGDAWLWFRALAVERGLGGAEATKAARDAALPAVLRAAALRGLASLSDPETPRVVSDVLGALPAADPDRFVLLEACAASARGWRDDLRKEQFRACVERLALALDDPKLSLDTRSVIVRNLAALFQTDVLGADSSHWIRELAAAAQRPEDAAPPEAKYAPGPFFGLPSGGQRVVFVIDASDSMLTPLSPDDLKRLAPTTPGDDKPAPRRSPSGPPEPEPIPWQKVKNRFDAAREVLKVSLRSLEKDRQFCVILFGTDAKALGATPGLRPADSRTVEAAVAELDRLKPEPAPGDKARPHGKLRGETNLHGGMRLAFKASPKGFMGPGEYVDLSRTGCDAVYLLSDGLPTTDDFRKTDKRENEQAVTDRETKTPTEPPPELTFEGPYGDRQFMMFDYLSDDVRRMNLIRNAVIHCVAIGEADDSLLRGIAEGSAGQFRRVGKE